jgi:hypothetical protein
MRIDFFQSRWKKNALIHSADGSRVESSACVTIPILPPPQKKKKINKKIKKILIYFSSFLKSAGGETPGIRFNIFMHCD